MARRFPSFPDGIRTPDFSSTDQESVSGWASGSDFLPATAGVGTTGATIGTTTGESNTTTIHTFRIAGPSSIETALIQDEGTSIMAPILVAGALAGMMAFTAPTRHTFREECTRAPSADSITAAMLELIPSEDSPALAASMVVASTEEASAAEAFTAGAAASTAAEATGSSHEVLNHETRNDKNDKQD